MVVKNKTDVEKDTSAENSNSVKYIPKAWFLNKNGNHRNFQDIKNKLMADLKINEVTATLLLNRGVNTKEKAMRFLYGTLDDLYSPFLLADMVKAAKRTALAITNNEKIGYFTDYDCDGISSNALFTLAFKRILKYDNVVSYIPHRELEGYGLNCPALQKLQDEGCTLVISADIGITAYKEADFCRQIGLDLIITDHHLPKLPDNYDEDDTDQFKYLPQALALINPNRPDDEYPFKGICGAMVVYKFLNALWIELGRDTTELQYLIPIVATATVADMVPLNDENRIVVKRGLEIMSREEQTGIVGLDALIDVCGFKTLNSDSIGFGLGPRINACGRLKHAMLAAELLSTDDPDFARERAQEVDGINSERKALTAAVKEEAFKQINEQYLEENVAICLYIPGVHVGVVGIGAGQVTNALNRPSILVTDHPERPGYLTGSARSIESIHILNVMLGCKDAFDLNDENDKFGGHSQAAGLTIHKDRFPKLQELVKQYFIKNPVKPEELLPRLMIDKALRLSEINGKLMEDIDFLAPFGNSNDTPKFGLKNVNCAQINFYANETIGITVKPEKNGPDIRGVGFSMHDLAKDIGLQDKVSAVLDIAFQPSWNEFQGVRKVQMMIEDFRLGTAK